MSKPSKNKNADDPRQKTHFLNMGFDGNVLKRNDLRQEESWKDEPKKRSVESGNKKGTFWTVCPYCYYMYEYESKYEERCLLCQNCRRGFHGLAVAAPPENSLVKGKEAECYRGYGFFPLGCSADSFLNDKKGVGGTDTGKKPVVVEISDDSDDEKGERDVKNEGGKAKVEIVNNGEGKGAIKRVKSVPRTTKKMMGRGISMKLESVLKMNVESEESEDEVEEGDGNTGSAKRVSSGSGSQGGCNEDDDLEFFEGDDDIFVGFRDIS